MARTTPARPATQCSSTPEAFARMVRDGFAIADRCVVADIETMATETGRTPRGRRIYDMRPLLDPCEQCGQTLDMMAQTVAYAYARGLIAPADKHPHVVVILNPTQD